MFPAVTPNTVGYNQGTNTDTVLTNRSKFITIVADEPYSQRHPKQREQQTTRKWLGPNKTTLSLEVAPVNTSYVSCMKSSFTGSKNLHPSKRPLSYPSQHTSQFSIGTAPHQEMMTHSRKTYVDHQTVPTYQLHEHNQRWNHQMSGKDMVESTRQNKYSEMNFDTTYTEIHDKLGRERGPGTRRCPPIGRKFNILTGEPVSSSQRELHLTSGNRILNNIRNSQEYRSLLR